MVGNEYNPNFQRNSEILNKFWRISENRAIVEHGNFIVLNGIRQSFNLTDIDIV